jgi:hypothetical protein
LAIILKIKEKAIEHDMPEQGEVVYLRDVAG